MLNSESLGINLDWSARFEGGRQLAPVVRLEMAHVESLVAVLSRALQNEPNFTYIFPDERARRVVLPWFFCSAIRISQLYGEVYTTETVDGGALWIGPGHALTHGRVVWPMSLKLGSANFELYTSLNGLVEEAHKRISRGPHWYLMALGVEASNEGNATGASLIEPVLSRADADGLPCYVETFHERNLPFYKRHGFRIEGGGHIPGDGPNFWSMVRPPQ